MAETLALTTWCTVAQHTGAPRLLVVQGTTVLAVSSARVMLTLTLHLLQAYISRSLPEQVNGHKLIRYAL